jgi:LDH2 family malate/lactate/ureidoglycolate dehydrogenase
MLKSQEPKADGRPAKRHQSREVPDVLTKTEDSRRVSAATLRTFLTDALRACGLPEADAATVAAAMLEADLTGSDAHWRVPPSGYVRQLKRGVMNPKARSPVVERSPATALIDGDHGMGHVVMTAAANLAVELARAAGVGWVGARRSNHAGAGAIYAAIPLAHGMVGIYGAGSSVTTWRRGAAPSPCSAPTDRSGDPGRGARRR